jgi:hypothetical protein
MHCLLCGRAAHQPGLCSVACVAAAQQEIDRNVQRYRALARDPSQDDARYAIATRNGLLTSAVLSYSRTVSPPPAPVTPTPARAPAAPRRDDVRVLDRQSPRSARRRSSLGSTSA